MTQPNEQPQTPPVDGPLANEDELDQALFGPYEEEQEEG